MPILFDPLFFFFFFGGYCSREFRAKMFFFFGGGGGGYRGYLREIIFTRVYDRLLSQQNEAYPTCACSERRSRAGTIVYSHIHAEKNEAARLRSGQAAGGSREVTHTSCLLRICCFSMHCIAVERVRIVALKEKTAQEFKQASSLRLKKRVPLLNLVRPVCLGPQVF